jgi:SAM-dependent methyltransferase
MAIDIEAARFLLAAARAGINFNECATLGRQFYLPGFKESRRLLSTFGRDPKDFPEMFVTHDSERYRYAEPFFKALGVQHLVTIDASDFEGATLVQDLNLPIPDELKSRFDVVYDGGTLEHVFNFPTAIRNCMEMTKTGGRVILHTPANNHFGHGFYQFSPELFFRIFSNQNGFTVERMIAMEYGPRRQWYEVVDPEVIRQRGSLINAFPVLLLVQARKLKSQPVFQSPPQQSDFSAVWSGPTKQDRRTSGPAIASKRFAQHLKRTLIEGVPGFARFLEALMYSSLNRNLSFRNRTAFKRIQSRTDSGQR